MTKKKSSEEHEAESAGEDCSHQGGLQKKWMKEKRIKKRWTIVRLKWFARIWIFVTGLEKTHKSKERSVGGRNQSFEPVLKEDDRTTEPPREKAKERISEEKQSRRGPQNL